MSEPRRPVIGLDLVLVALLALAMLLPGVWRYSLVDPWETHYGEVSRRMLDEDDLVWTKWQDEGFRSKPVLTFWLMAGSMKALDVADDGGYSGEMVSSERVMLALRLPFVLFGVLGLCAAWWMLARLASRRIAWLSLLVLGSTPFYLLVARQAITDMTLVGSMVGAIAMFAVAAEVGDEPVRPIFTVGRIRRFTFDHRHLFLLVIGGFLMWQALYYIGYFTRSPQLGRGAPRLGGLHPGLVISIPMFLGMMILGAMELPGPAYRPIRAVAYWITAALAMLPFGAARAIVQGVRGQTEQLADAPPTTTSRQVYLWWFWAFLGISVLGKGLPALGIVGIVCAFYVILLGKWRDFIEDRYELVRGFMLVALIAVPWHVAMFFKDGGRFAHDYFITHLWNRAAVGVHGERGTFDFYASQIGYGMFVWAGLVPAAMAALVLRSRVDTVEGRCRFVVATWAVASVAFFCFVQTKFHHYILPAIPALAIAIGFWLDDVIEGRARHIGVAAVIGAGIVLVIANDMMSEPKQWIEMFIYRYDRPWPSDDPWAIDVSDGFLWLAIAAALALGLLAIPRLAKAGVVAICTVGLVTALWSIHVYMPIAGQHWGMREALREYYERREIHGMRLVYYGGRQLAADWAAPGKPNGVRDDWTIRTFVPETAQEGQPAVFRITVKSADDKRTEQDLRIAGVVDRVDVEGAALHVTIPPEETRKLERAVAAGAKGKERANRPPVRWVDADRLIAWNLYWRGENFWSGGEIWGPLPEYKTALNQYANKTKIEDFLNKEDCPVGRRYWVITEAGRARGMSSSLPTDRAKETYRVENTVSNKFSLASFVL